MQNLFETLSELYDKPPLLDEMNQIVMAVEKDKAEALNISAVRVSGQSVKCAYCSREIRTIKDACSGCRIAYALAD